MLEFQLFRTKLIAFPDSPLFRKEIDRKDYLGEIIKTCPTTRLKRGAVWHVGNVESVGNAGLYFRLGRTTKTTVQVLADGNFLDQDFETAPYTHGFMELDRGLCALAKKTQLAPRTINVALQLARLMQNAEPAVKSNLTIEMHEIADPKDFIYYINQAWEISKFSFSFSLPNPWDVNKDFVKPTQRMLETSKGERGKTDLMGESLDPNVLEDVARSAAATGDEAAASVRMAPGEKLIKKRLGGNPITIRFEKIESADDKKSFFQKMMNAYQNVRKS